VSNPPYVTLAEKTNMKKNVTEYEPPEALFVPDDDPLIFYSAIAGVGKKVLRSNGKVIVEVTRGLVWVCRSVFERGVPFSFGKKRSCR